MYKAVEEWRIPVKAKANPPPELTHPWPQQLFLSPTSDEEARKELCRAHRKTQVSKVNYFKKNRENWDRYSSASSDQDTIVLLSGHYLLLPDLSVQPNSVGVPL